MTFGFCLTVPRRGRPVKSANPVPVGFTPSVALMSRSQLLRQLRAGRATGTRGDRGKPRSNLLDVAGKRTAPLSFWYLFYLASCYRC